MRGALLVLLTLCYATAKLSLNLQRDPDYGVPLILGGEIDDVFYSLGWAHAEDRLFQITLRLAAASARLADLLGDGPDNANVEADMVVATLAYSKTELDAQWHSVLDNTARTIYSAYCKGLYAGVEAWTSGVFGPPPAEFALLGIAWPPPMFLYERRAVLAYAVFTMQRLTSGWNPIGQLQNARLLARLNSSDAFHDLVTTLGAFPLENSVLSGPYEPGKPPKGGGHAATAVAAPALASHAWEWLERFVRVERHLLRLGAVAHDGSWAAVMQGAPDEHGTSQWYAQFGPQDANQFPTTFYEAFIDTKDVQAHFWSEPGMPLNQIYFLSAAMAAGRTRGQVLCNDYLDEPVSNTHLHHVRNIHLRNGTTLTYNVYRSKSGGFVVSRDGKRALTLRTAFLGEDIRALNFLSHYFLAKNMGDLKGLLGAPFQSPTLHSHLLVVQNGNVGALLNGLSTTLPSEVDRRLPLVLHNKGDALPPYTVVGPLESYRSSSYFFSWNTPYATDVPWGVEYLYGGWWRSEWIQRWFDANPVEQLDFSGVLGFKDHQAVCSSVALLGDSDQDQFVRIWPTLRELVNVSQPERDLLDSFDGSSALSLGDLQAGDYSDAFVLSQAWLYAMMQRVFVPILGRESSPFELPVPHPRLGIPTERPNSRLTAMMVLLFNVTEAALLRYPWLGSQSLAQLASAALHETLATLGPRPWGVGMRPNVTMDGVGGALGPVAQLPASQLPSLHVTVQLTNCGPVRVASSVPFGVSGTVGAGRNFSAHALDQWPLYVAYLTKEGPQLFQASQQCIAAAPLADTGLVLGVTIGVTLGLVLLIWVVWLVQRRIARRHYEPIADEPTSINDA